MATLLTFIAVLSLLSFLLKVSFFSRPGAATAAFGLALTVWMAIPWLTQQSPADLAAWTSTPAHLLDGAICIVLEVVLMAAFCFSRPTGKLHWLRFYPGLLAAVALCGGCAQLLFSRPGLDFERFAWIASLVTLAATYGGTRLLRHFMPVEEARLESLFLVNLFLLLLTVAATGAVTF